MMELYKRAILKIFGRDAKEFLQNLVTNDINQKEAFYSLILSPTGRYVFDFFVIQKDDCYFIDIAEMEVENFIRKLNITKLKKEVIIENFSSIYSVIYSEMPIANSFFSYKDPRYIGLCYRNILPTSRDIDSNLNLYLEHKFNHSIPDGVIDLIKDKSFPQEFGLDKLNSISFKKGCYVGQESVSRIRTQGVVRKGVFKIISNLDFHPNVKLDIFHEAEKIGMVTSFYKNLAIGQIFLFENFDINLSFKLEDSLIKLEYPSWKLS
jgi:folate-binding protein YgfZ